VPLLFPVRKNEFITEGINNRRPGMVAKGNASAGIAQEYISSPDNSMHVLQESSKIGIRETDSSMVFFREIDSSIVCVCVCVCVLFIFFNVCY
jgi:hypothetical protein